MAHAGCETKTNEMMRVLSTFETCEVVKRLQNLERERRESWRRPEDIFCGAPPLTLLHDDRRRPQEAKKYYLHQM